MSSWDMANVAADFFEVVPENWIRRDRTPLHRLIESGRPVHLHGVSLNLGGTSVICKDFLKEIKTLMEELGTEYYSDHLAASGDAHQLYDLFPIPFTRKEVIRVSDRIKYVQDQTGCRIAIENTTWYTNIGSMPEPEFLSAVAERADCGILLDLNNIAVNFKNHGRSGLQAFIHELDLSRITYLHVAGHEFDERFGLYVDTHSQPVEDNTRALALRLHHSHALPILLEWDNDVPEMSIINQELAWLRSTTT